MPTIEIFADNKLATLEAFDASSYVNARQSASADSVGYGSNGTQPVGQQKLVAGWYVWRGCLIFDPSALAGTALTEVILKLNVNIGGVFSAINDAQSLYTLDGSGDIADGGVIAADFGELLDDTTSLGSITSAAWALLETNDWAEITLNATGITALETAISGGNLFKLALRSQHDIDNVADTGTIEYNRFDFKHTNITPSTNRPKLSVTYIDPPTVTTQTCESVVGATATGRGNITDLGGESSTAHGHCWNTTVDPVTTDSVVDNGAASATGEFTSTITGLTPGTGYYTRAYATNSAGTAYGANVYFVASLDRAGYIWMETDDNFRGFDEDAVERKYIHTDDVDDAPVNGATTAPVSSNWAFDHAAAADPHTGYVLESLFNAHTALYATTDNTPVALTLTEQTLMGRLTGGNISAVALGISDNNVAQIDGTTNAPANLDYAKFTTSGLEGKSYQELVNDISGVIKATDVEVSELSTATYDDAQDYVNFFGDRTLLSGGAISDNGDGSATVALGKAWVKETDSDTAVGKFFDFSADASVALTDLTTNYIYIDYNAGTPQIVVSTDILTHGFKQDHIHIGTIFRNGTTLHFHQEDNLGIGRMNIVDMYHLEKGDAERASGLVTTDGGSLALSITTGVVYEGLSRHATIVDGSTWSTWYTSDSGSTWIEVTAQSTIDNTQYNDITSGLATLTASRYAVHWVYVDIDGENLHIVYGQGDYTANQAEEASVPSVLPNLVTNYGILIAKVVVQKSDTTLVISYPWTSVFTSSLATDHGSLGGLADDDHAQYIKDAEFTQDSSILVGTGSGTFAEETGATLRTSIGLGNVENTAHSTDAHTMTIDGIDVSAHDIATTGVHGISGTIVGTSESQALTNKSYNGLTLTSTTGTFTLASGKTLTVNNTLTLTATDTATLAIGGGGTLGTAAYTASTDYVAKSTFDAHSILIAVSDNTPVKLDVAASRMIGRAAAGNIVALAKADILTLINVTEGADVTGSNAPQAHTASHTDGTDDIQESSTAQKGICQLDDTPVNGETNEPITSNWAFDHAAAADPHAGYVLETLFDADTFLYASSDDTPVATSPANVLAALSGHAGAEFLFNTQKIGGVVDPTTDQQVATKKYVDDNAGGGYTEGARVYHSGDQTISTGSATILAFDSEMFDTDTIHDTVTNNSRLTCVTAGKYLIISLVSFATNATGVRNNTILLNGATVIGTNEVPPTGATLYTGMVVACIYDLGVDDYVEARVYQNSGGNLNVMGTITVSSFMMQRIG